MLKGCEVLLSLVLSKNAPRCLVSAYSNETVKQTWSVSAKSRTAFEQKRITKEKAWVKQCKTALAILVYHFRIYFNIIISISFQYHVIGLVQFEKAQPFVNGGDTTQKNATLTGVTVQHIKRDGTLEAHPSDHVPWLFELKWAMEIKGPWLFRVFFLGDYCILIIGVMSYNFICLSFQQTQRHLSNGKRAWLFAVFFGDYCLQPNSCWNQQMSNGQKGPWLFRWYIWDYCILPSYIWDKLPSTMG